MARLVLSDLQALASDGGYSLITSLSDITAVFLLSACLPLRDRQLWENQIMPISDATYQSILAMIEQAEYELMTSFAIGQIISTVTTMANDNLILLDGSTIDGLEYPELWSVVPASWIDGDDIILPNMSQKGVFGENADVGDIIGENTVQLQISELPSHTHVQNIHSHSEVIPVVAVALGGEIPATASLVTASPSTTGGTIATNQNTGNDDPHNNIQESLSVYWYIVAR
jgi:microcystin-dependent protein